MKLFKAFIPALCGVIIILLSYYFDSALLVNIEADKNLALQTSSLLEHEQVDEEARKIVNGAINSILENNHELLKEGNDVVWAIGLGILFWSFPYHVVLRVDAKKI